MMRWSQYLTDEREQRHDGGGMTRDTHSHGIPDGRSAQTARIFFSRAPRCKNSSSCNKQVEGAHKAEREGWLLLSNCLARQ